ncbi:putative uncharacterized protein [Parachlamydia acanthamoebae UV-7]|jgi:sulfite exporter TauE/SafE|uniref:Urease accessory protein UreH-like transmembrane domain-containing protein n=2 Tax=Parachlamydia acanthamoebae TaxID=83552 RepID=F8KXJ6_PARAV|nr:sulfite exporter TauE/SafE family protein [Parachlamydia acanthamoebae]CCB87212.1 putative uncharacterized protein [Parachlamydia acanthamoebae UV-7]
MSLLISMLPLYIFGNLHCMGMCGPLTLMIGQHRYRYFYFFGRMLSYMLVGMIAGGLGTVLHLLLKKFHVMESVSLLFGGSIFFMGIYTLMGWQYPGLLWISKRLAKFNAHLTTLILQDRAWPSFFFGFFTVLLPCGQTLIVFSACALSGDLWIGMLNGFAFALLTSPSLLLAMQAHHLLSKLKAHYALLMGGSAMIIGSISICRGLAEIELIEHLTFESPFFHLAIY